MSIVGKNLESNPNGKYDLSKCLASPEVVALIESMGLSNCSASRSHGGFDDDHGGFRSGQKQSVVYLYPRQGKFEGPEPAMCFTLLAG